MLSLVVADRDDVGLVEQDVAGHQDRVGEEAGRDELAALALVLELRHPAELAVARHAREQPRRLGVRGHVALDEDDRALGIEPGGKEQRGQVERGVAQLGRVVVGRDRVQVDDAEEPVAALLRRRVLAEPARVVAEVLRARRLDAGEDPHRLRLAAAYTDRPWSPLPGGIARRCSSRSGRTPRAWRRSSASCTRMPPLVFAGEARQVRSALGGGRRGPRVPAPGRRLRRVVPRLREADRHRRRVLRGRDPRAAADPAADGGSSHLRRRPAGAEGRPDRGPVRQAAQLVDRADAGR